MDWRKNASDGFSRSKSRLNVRVAVFAFAGAIIAWGVLLRVKGLDLQSFWVDETWSAGVASLPLRDSLHTLEGEVHPPLFGILLWGWVHAGGTGISWVRSLSVLLGVASVFTSYWMLRGSDLDRILRALITATTAASGFAIVYSQEARSYSLLYLTAVGLTAATITLGAPNQPPREWRTFATWLAWALFASSTHLFGAALVACCGVALALTWRADIWRCLVLTALGLMPQVLWLAYGLTVPGFAGGASWITAPTIQDLWIASTSLFAFGGLQITPGGFIWTSSLEIGMLAGIIVATLIGPRAIRDTRHYQSGGWVKDWYPASLLGPLALLVVAGSWLAAQVMHVWTIRNLIAVLPAASWFVAAILCALGRQVGVWSRVALSYLLVLALTLTSVTAELSRTYKTDYSAAVQYLTQTRSETPSALFVGNFNANWLLAAGLPNDKDFQDWLWSPSINAENIASPEVRPRPGTTVYAFSVFDVGDSEAKLKQSEDVVRRAGGWDSCTVAPILGLILVQCHEV